MPFELSESLKNTCSMTFASRGVNAIFSNKIYTSAILTIMIIVLIMILYPGKKGTPFWIVGKLGVYIFLVSLAVIFIHNGVVYSAFENKKGNKEIDGFISNLGDDSNIAFKGDNIAVKPKTNINIDNKNVKGGFNYAGENDDFFASFGV